MTIVASAVSGIFDVIGFVCLLIVGYCSAKISQRRRRG
jgi:sugar phosphate permease